MHTIQETENKQFLREWQANPRPLKLRGAVQHYAWGGYRNIPDLLGLSNEKSDPYAELWLGAHPKAPASLQFDHTEISLPELLRHAGAQVLGAELHARYDGSLPFLFKVLDARQMLSIQVHPNKRQAREGFNRENALSIPLTARHRNYRDDNHKPEIHVALGDFWMLHGFRPLEEIHRQLQAIPEFRSLSADFNAHLEAAGNDPDKRCSALRLLYKFVMEMPQTEVDAHLEPLIRRLTPLYEQGRLDKNTPDFWAVRAAEHFPMEGGHFDRGIFSIYLLNLLHLTAGEGTYQAAGVLHAYLEGWNVELMATSDNVLRGGLTPKHVDVPELLKILSYDCGKPAILRGVAAGDGETVYAAPIDEFMLTTIVRPQGTVYNAATRSAPDILILLAGSVELRSKAGILNLHKGDAVFIPAAIPYSIHALNDAYLSRASVPVGATQGAATQ